MLETSMKFVFALVVGLDMIVFLANIFFAVIDAGYRTFEKLSLLLEHPLMTLDRNLFNSQLTKPKLSPHSQASGQFQFDR